MASILYVETSFAISVAKGQDPEGERLLAADLASVQLVIPGLCFIEACSAWNLEEKQRRLFVEQLKHHAREASRDRTSERAATLLSSLERSKDGSLALINDIKSRLRQVLDNLSRSAEIIQISREVVQQAMSEGIIDDMTDNLILWSILSHAREAPEQARAFVSSNHQDFDRPDILAALGQVGVKYFRRTEAALGWLQSIADPSLDDGGAGESPG